MTDIAIYVRHEKFGPLVSVEVEAFRTDTGTILATTSTGNAKAFTDLSGHASFKGLITTELDPTDPDGKKTRNIPYFFRPRVTRNSAGSADYGVVELHLPTRKGCAVIVIAIGKTVYWRYDPPTDSWISFGTIPNNTALDYNNPHFQFQHSVNPDGSLGSQSTFVSWDDGFNEVDLWSLLGDPNSASPGGGAGEPYAKKGPGGDSVVGLAMGPGRIWISTSPDGIDFTTLGAQHSDDGGVTWQADFSDVLNPGPAIYGEMAAHQTDKGRATLFYLNTPADVPPIEVSITNDPDGTVHFSPDPVTIHHGEVVKWTNNGNVNHSSIDLPFWNSGVIVPGGSWTQAIKLSPGTYHYISALPLVPPSPTGTLTVDTLLNPPPDLLVSRSSVGGWADSIVDHTAEPYVFFQNAQGAYLGDKLIAATYMQIDDHDVVINELRIYASGNDGGSWNKVYSEGIAWGAPQILDGLRLRQVLGTPGAVYVSTHNGILRSTNGSDFSYISQATVCVGMDYDSCNDRLYVLLDDGSFFSVDAPAASWSPTPLAAVPLVSDIGPMLFRNLAVISI